MGQCLLPGRGGFLFQARGCEGWVRWDWAWVLCFELPVCCLYFLPFRQVFPNGSGCLCEELVEESVLGPFGELHKRSVLRPVVVEDPHLWEGYVYHGERGAGEFDGAHATFGAAVEVSTEDRQGACLQAGVVGEDGMVWRGE